MSQTRTKHPIANIIDETIQRYTDQHNVEQLEFWNRVKKKTYDNSLSSEKWDNILQNIAREKKYNLDDHSNDTIKKINAQVTIPLQGESINLIYEYAGIFTKIKIDHSRSPQEIQDLPILKALFDHVINGEEKEAQEIINKYPYLLFIQEDVYDKNTGRTITNVTPFECAYGADDVEMCRMMLKYIPNNKKEEVLKQLDAKFPSLKEEKNGYDFTPLIKAIMEYEKGEVEAVLEQFRADFKSNGKHFNIKILADAIEVFSNEVSTTITPRPSDAWHLLWDLQQLSLFWCKVIGYLQRQVPACYAQALCQGVRSLVVNERPLRRSAIFHHLYNTPFYPSNLNLHSGLGFDFAVDSYGMERELPPFYYRDFVKNVYTLKIYVEQKKQALAELRQSLVKLNESDVKSPSQQVFNAIVELKNYGIKLMQRNEDKATRAGFDTIKCADQLEIQAKNYFSKPSTSNKLIFKNTLVKAIDTMSNHRNYNKLPLTILVNIAFVIGTGGLGLFAFVGWVIHANLKYGKVASHHVFFAADTERQLKAKKIDRVFGTTCKRSS